MTKLLFFINDDLLYFCLANFIKKQSEFKIHAIADVTVGKKKFLESQSFLKFDSISFFHDYASKKLKNPDMEYLKQIEKKYDINLWNLAINERYFSKDVDFFHKFTKEEILCILENECRFYEKVLSDVKPDFLIIQMPMFHYDYLFYLMCKKLGINIMLLGVARGFAKRCMISEEYDQLPKYDLSDAKKHDFKTFEELQSYLEKNDFYEEVLEYKNNFLTDKISMIKASLKYLFHKNSNSKYFTYFGRNKFQTIFNTVWLNLIEKYRFWYLEKHSLKNLDGCKQLIFFPLHVQPEGTFTLNAPFLTNQLEVINHISKSIPINYTLLIKEHPVMNTRGYRDLSFYREISRLPNVKLVSTNMPSNEIIKKSDLVVTITGTAGLEAAFYGKPSIVLANVMFEDIKSVSKIKHIDNLSKTIKNSLTEKITPQDLIEYIYNTEKNSFSFDFIGMQISFSNEFFYGGFFTDVNISETKFNKYMDDNHDSLSILALEHLKIIQKKLINK
jgi:hypothetical protein